MQHKFPTLIDLTTSEAKLIKSKRDQLNTILNIEPKKEWVLEHPMTKTKYIPIQIIENTLTTIFQEWSVEVKEVKQIFNSITVIVRVHYKDPITGDMRFQDGVGAAPLQVDKGSLASNMQAIKSNAVQLGLPAAKSYAIKDAVEHIGRLFGRDISRKDTPDFKPQYIQNDPELVEKKRVIKYIEDAKSVAQLEQIASSLNSAGTLTTEYAQLINSKKQTL